MAYFKFCCEIRIEGIKPISRVLSINIEQGWDNLTQTATIKMPRKVQITRGGALMTEQRIDTVLKKGAKIEILLGYDGDLVTEFVGYIARVQTGSPTVIHCEDEMYKLKQMSFSKNLPSVSLKKLLAEMLPTYKIHAIDMQLGNVRSVTPESPAKVLQGLKTKFGLVAYFRNNELYVGFAYELQGGIKRHLYRFSQNVAASSLQYKDKDEVKIKIKVHTIDAHNKKSEYEIGDPDGDVRTLPLLNNVPESQLPAIAKAELEKYKLAGFDGTFTTWGIPRAAHGDIADIEDGEYPEHNGSYYMKKVEISASADGGFRRTITLHKQTVPLTTDKVRKQRAKQKS